MQQTQWKGSKPMKFSGGRMHIKPQNQLASNLQPQISNHHSIGLRTFKQHGSQQIVYKPGLKIFPNHYRASEKEIDLKGKLYLELPEQKQKRRPERTHFPNLQTIDEVKLKGLQTFEHAYQLNTRQYSIESKMKRKGKFDTFVDFNNHPSRALGDKNYKYPEYSDKFYHEGGLIPGSTIRSRTNRNVSERKISAVLKKPNWDIRVKMDEKQQEKKVVNAVDEWERTILKEANPNWNDPETFFEREEAKKNKDPKKGGKK